MQVKVFFHKSCISLYVLAGLLSLSSCEQVPLFNFIAQKEYSSDDFVVGPPLALGDIKRVGSVYGTPGAGEGGTSHNGIDIGADEGTAFIAGVPGIIVEVIEGRDNYSQTKHVELQYNSEFSVIYLFEPDKKIVAGLGRSLDEGEIIGYLGKREAGYIDQCVHFGIKRHGEWVCPVPYLDENLRDKLNEIYKRDHSNPDPENICGCPEHQRYFK